MSDSSCLILRVCFVVAESIVAGRFLSLVAGIVSAVCECVSGTWTDVQHQCLQCKAANLQNTYQISQKTCTSPGAPLFEGARAPRRRARPSHARPRAPRSSKACAPPGAVHCLQTPRAARLTTQAPPGASTPRDSDTKSASSGALGVTDHLFSEGV